MSNKTYVTKQGEMWDSIAYRLYGTEKAINVLLEANEEYREVAVFGAGTVLNVPEYNAPRADNLPPWRR